MKGPETNWKQRADEARARAEGAINELKIKGAKINFNSVAKTSGVSKSFLYDDKTTRERIEQLRLSDVEKKMNKRAGYDKTSKSKDVIIAAKDRRMAKLKEENRKLRSENECLRGRLYDMKQLTSTTCSRCKNTVATGLFGPDHEIHHGGVGYEENNYINPCFFGNVRYVCLCKCTEGRNSYCERCKR